MAVLNINEVAKRLDTGNIPITITDATLPDMPLIYVNPAFVRCTGFSVHQSVGQNCRFLQSDLDNTVARQQMRKAIKDGIPAQIVFENRRADGTVFDNLVVIEPLIDLGGNPAFHVGAQFVIDRATKPAAADAAGRVILSEIDKLLVLNERLRATSRQALARSMAAAVKLWLER